MYRSCFLGRGERCQEYGLALPYLAAYSGKTVCLLLVEVLNKFPNWRIVIGGKTAEVSRLASAIGWGATTFPREITFRIAQMNPKPYDFFIPRMKDKIRHCSGFHIGSPRTVRV